MARKVKRLKVRRITPDKLKPTSWDLLLNAWDILGLGSRSPEPRDWSRFWSAFRAAPKDEQDRMTNMMKRAISPFPNKYK